MNAHDGSVGASPNTFLVVLKTGTVAADLLKPVIEKVYFIEANYYPPLQSQMQIFHDQNRIIWIRDPAKLTVAQEATDRRWKFWEIDLLTN